MDSNAIVTISGLAVSFLISGYSLWRGTKSDKVVEQSGLVSGATSFSNTVLEDNRILRERIKELESISSPKKLKKRVTEIAKEVNGN